MLKTSLYICALLLLCSSFNPKIVPTPYPFPHLYFFPDMPTSPDNPVTVEGVNLGRNLFYDPILSGDSTMSCSGCHRQEAAFSDAPINFSKGRNNLLMKRNTMPLFNLAWYKAYFWDGKAATIEEQILHPVRTVEEMNISWSKAEERVQKNAFYRKRFREAFGKKKIDSVQITNAIGQFLRTLLSYQSKYDSVLTGKTFFTADELKGFELVNDQTKGDCLHCHTTDGNALGTTGGFSNNGLDPVYNTEEYADKGRGAVTGHTADIGQFKIPSLRNIAFTAPYMHDGRFKTLEEVLDFYSNGINNSINIDSKMEFAHRGGARLSDDEKKKIKAFLITLSDSAFIKNPDYGNPFSNRR